MEFRKVRALRGPNIWAAFPVLEAWVDLGALKDSPSDELPGFNERLTAWLPSLVEHRCSVGKRSGFFERLRRGTYQAHILEHVTLELQGLAGTEVGYGRARETNEEGVYKVAIEYEYEELARACLQTARELCLAAVQGRPFDIAAELNRLREFARTVAHDPFTAAILAEARRRNIPVIPLGARGFFQLGHGVHQRRIWAGRSDRTGAIAEGIARDQELTRTLLRASGVPVPAGRLVQDADDAWEAAQEVGLPAVVRPRNGNDSRAIGRGLTTCEEVRAAYDAAREECSSVMVERCASGHDFRLLVIGKKVAAAARRDAGRSKSATGTDVTDVVHPDVAALALDAARAVGLDVAGVDVVALDLSQPLQEQGGVVVGVHPRPGLRLHLHPAAGAAQSLGRVFVEHLLPAEQTGRMPIVAVTGVNGKTTTTRLIGHMAARWGRVVGMTCTEGIYVGGRRIEAGDCSGPLSARTVLQNPSVEVGVLETARGGILRAGLAFDQCDVAVITNIADGDHLGISDIDTPEQLARVKRTIVEAVAPSGAAVLNADDPLVADMAAHCPGAAVFFALDGNHPVLASHQALGGRVAFVRDNHILLAEGDQEIPLVPLDLVPLTHGGRVGFQVQNALAAAAAAWSLGVPCEVIRVGLETFAADVERTPGRFNLVDYRGATVVLDYGHNPASLAALIKVLAQLPHRRRTAVYSAAGDRRDVDILRQAEQLAAAFDRVVLYEDPNCNRNRADGEIFALFRRGLGAGRRVSQIEEIRGAVAAVEHALESARPGELVLAQVDLVDETIERIRQALALGAAREIDFREAAKLARVELTAV
jgi:cyanophycin synthetase